MPLNTQRITHSHTHSTKQITFHLPQLWTTLLFIPVFFFYFTQATDIWGRSSWVALVSLLAGITHCGEWYWFVQHYTQWYLHAKTGMHLSQSNEHESIPLFSLALYNDLLVGTHVPRGSQTLQN
jgi:hypothetical protein